MNSAPIYGLPCSPAVLMSVLDTEAADCFVAGLMLEFAPALLAGKIDAWAECAGAVMRLAAIDAKRRLLHPETPNGGQHD